MKESRKGASCEDMQEGKYGEEEADFFVGDYAEGESEDKRNPCEA